MEIAMIGLGKMGANMTTRLLGKGHRVVVLNLKEEAPFGDKLLAAMRNQFGGHAVKGAK
jgi:6-phosphogluconate dehydrogenase (decarboxylating)